MTKDCRPEQAAEQPSSPVGRLDYEVGYRRPPQSTRFKPGKSGNPKGRPKGCKNLNTRLREIYLAPVTINDRRGRRVVPMIEVILRKQLVRAANGNDRAVQAAVAMAKMLGVFDEATQRSPSYVGELTDDEIKLLSDTALAELIEIERKRQQQADRLN